MSRLPSMALRRHQLRRNILIAGIRQKSTFPSYEDCGVPEKPTWSVQELLSSYPQPTMSPAMLTRLHRLSALIPPEEGTKEHQVIKRELEDMIRLVEAVKLVDTGEVRDNHTESDERSIDTDIPLSGLTPGGKAILKHASRTQDGYYVVDMVRKRC